MQQLLKFTALVALATLFSCETLVPKTYKLHARNVKQEEALNKLLAENGVYKIQMDTLEHKLSFMYSSRQNDLSMLDNFFVKNGLINPDTASEVVDSSYLFIDEQNAIIDSLDKIDSIAKAKALILEEKRIKQARLDSLQAVLEHQDSAKAPMIEILEVF